MGSSDSQQHEQRCDHQLDVGAGFRDPPTEYGPVPLWWWDGEDLDEQRMTEQLEALADGGVPSVCFISKYPTGPAGEEEQYFGEEWWDRMEHVAAECERLGMELWVHDETYHHSPPSWREFWQHRIRAETTQHERLQGYVLARESAEISGGGSAALSLPEDLNVLTAAAYPRGDDGAIDVDGAIDLDPGDGELQWSADEGDWHVAAVGIRPEGLCYTNEAAVERYIDLHFEEYRRRLGEDVLDNVLVGTFEDELVVLDDEVPCDDAVLDSFEAEYGYDPVPHLVGLYEDVEGGAGEFRADYYDVVTSLLEDNWFQPLYDWHEEHGLVRSHDNWGRNDLSNGTTQYGDYYRTMRWYQVPGYDDGGQADIGSRNFFDAKLAASIAACYDRDRVWGELFHSTGWGFTPEDQLAGVVENYCYGANLYDKHGCYYTTRGGWWAHAAPDVHFRQPYWDDVEGLNDAATRLSYLFSQGHPVVDVAMLYPSTSLHADWRPDDGISETGTRVDERTREIVERIYEAGSDIVLADPDSLANADLEGGTLGIQDMEIPVLLLGPTTAVQAETVEALRSFHDDGGVVVAVEQLPTTVVGGERADLDDALEEVFGDAYRTGQDGDVQGQHRHDSADGGVGVLAAAGTDFVGLVDGIVERDVRRSAGDLYHTHRKVGDLDAYLLFNVRDEERNVGVDLRASGTPERWDPVTGETDAISTYDRGDRHLSLELSFDPHGFHVIVLDGTEDGDPRVVETSLSAVESVEETGDSLAVTGRARSSGSHWATVEAGGGRRRGQVEAVTVPETIQVGGEWKFDLRPTMDNEWGDFRYPPDDDVIGAEVREIVHRAERPDEDGLQQGWHRPDIEETSWDPVDRTYGPYLWRQTGVEGASPTAPDEDPAGWEPYEFSQRFGKPGTHAYMLGYTSVLSDDYLVSPDGEGTTHFWTTVRSDEDRTVACHYGPGVETIDLGAHHIDAEGDDHELATGAGPDAGGTAIVHLPAGKTELRIAVEPDVQTYVALEAPDGSALDREMRYEPQLRWFEVDGVDFDYRPWDDSPVGWYRFEAPAGTRSFDLPVRGEARVWIEGQEHPVEDNSVTFDQELAAPSTVAVRVEQDDGAYGGATFERSPAVETEPVAVDRTAWEDLGLDSYSGQAQYRTTVTVPELAPDDRVVLDLGDVAVTATVRVNGTEVGSAFRRPFEFDVTDPVEPGANDLEIVVANTLANHFDAETPKRYAREALEYFAGDVGVLPTVDRDEFPSGLFGPVTLRVEPAVTIEATE